MTEEQQQLIRSTDYFTIVKRAVEDPELRRLLRDDPDTAIRRYFGVPVDDMDDTTRQHAREAAGVALHRLRCR